MKRQWARLQSQGFTVVEILIVILVIGILAGIVYVNFAGSNEKTYLSRANVEFSTMHNALKLYALQHNDYPADVSRGLPSGIEEFVTDTDATTDWPNGPWPGSVYDYDRWTINGVDTYQISVRFCPAGASDTSLCKFPKQPWASSFGVNSAYYYCIKGNCRSHQSEPAAYPGYCVNCPNNQAIGT